MQTGSYTGRDLNSLNCYINRKFKGLCGAVKAEKGPCVGQASPPRVKAAPRACPSSPNCTFPFSSTLRGRGSTGEGVGGCFLDKSELFQLQPGMAHALQQPGCLLLFCEHRSSEASLATILQKSGTGLFMDGKVWRWGDTIFANLEMLGLWWGKGRGSPVLNKP